MRADIAGAEAIGIPGILVRRPHEAATHYCANLSGVPATLRAESTA
jgi:FMN phosphatase YigB (HAD superfamily)